MNSFLNNLLLTLVCVVGYSADIFAQKFEFYGINPLWGEKVELSRSFWTFNPNPSWEDTVFSSPKPIDTFFNRLEAKTDIRCTIGFYFTDIDSSRKLDVFVLYPNSFFVESCTSYDITNGLTSQQKRDIISISKGEQSSFSMPSRKYLLFEYLLLYETEYYSRHPYYGHMVVPLRSAIAKKYKINGRIRARRLPTEIDKALNGEKNAVFEIIKTTIGRYDSDPKFRRFRKRYIRKFAKHPHLYYYLSAVAALYDLKRTSPASIARGKKVERLNEALNAFLQLDSLDYTNKEKRLWRRLGRVPLYARNQLLEISSATIKCSDYEKLAIKKEKEEKYNDAIKYYSQSIKFCGDTSNFHKIRDLLTKKIKLYGVVA